MHRSITTLSLLPLVLACLITTAAFAQETEKLIDRFEAHQQPYTDEAGNDRTLPYRLLKPAKVEDGKRYPVVLFLHGAGERGSDNQSQLKFLPTWLSEKPLRTKYPCYLIAPQCPSRRTWGTLLWSDDPNTYDDDPSPEMRAAKQILEKVIDEHSVDPDRVYLTGLSMGGFGSWEMAARWPDRFTAVAPICGGGDPSRAEALAKLPIWAWHGGADNVVPPERSRQMVEAVRNAGGDIKYTELPDVGHNSWTPAYTNGTDTGGLLPWLFKQKRSR